MMLGYPRVSVLIPTIYRPQSVVGTVGSLLSDPSPTLRVIVIDQHEDGLAHRAINASDFARDSRLQVIVTQERGESVARNVGLRVADGDFILCTDDDCIAPPGWATSLTEALESGGHDLVFGPLEAIESSNQEAFTPSWTPPVTGSITKRAARRANFGTTANLAVRRSVIERLSGFDPLLGAGCVLGGADDIDLIYRALVAGYRVGSVSAPSMHHHGQRVGKQEVRALTRRNFLGIGAWYMKHIRFGDRKMLVMLIGDLSETTFQLVKESVRQGRPEGFGKVVYLLLGLARSFRFRVDPRTRVYRPQDARVAAAHAAPL